MKRLFKEYGCATMMFALINIMVVFTSNHENAGKVFETLIITNGVLVYCISVLRCWTWFGGDWKFNLVEIGKRAYAVLIYASLLVWMI